MDYDTLGNTFRQLNFVAALRERQRVQRLCQDLMKLNARIGTDTPDLPVRERYRNLVQQQCGATPAASMAAIRRAEESFATWPKERPLTLRDIAQYLAVTDCLKIDIAEAGVDSARVDRAFQLVKLFIPVNI